MTTANSDLTTDGRCRCGWAKSPHMILYHDTEWGVPVYDDRLLFEFIILEGAQAGLSWDIILRRRENYKAAFDNCDPEKVARYSAAKIESLLNDTGIIRNRLKILSAVSIAQAFLAVADEHGSFSDYIWSFVDHQPVINTWKTTKELPAVTPLAETISKDLRKRGFKFLGPIVMYAHMQATGMVNDHIVDCFRWTELGGKK